MSGRISRFTRYRGEVAVGGVSDPARPDGRRYFEAAETNRLNESHWVYAVDSGINAWLIRHLHTVRARAMYEARNNPIVAGVIRSLVLGVVGQRPPTLQMQSTSKAYNDRVEEYWSERCDELDLNGQLSFYDILCQAIGMLPTCGEALLQIVSEDGLVKVMPHEPRRLESLIAFRSFGSGEHSVLGIKRTRTGKPLEYSFRDWDDATGSGTFRYLTVPADQIVHFYEIEYPGQVRGIPLLASSLMTSAELRDFDTATLRAARTAAEHTVLLEATGPDVEYQTVDSEITIETGTMGTLPPGYKATQLAPEHPANGYVEFRHERLRELGRPMNMPLMMVLLDSQNMNYSSARFDSQMFSRGTSAMRTRAEHAIINRILDLVIIEGQARGRIPATPPRRVRAEWGWQPVPEVDDLKAAEARRLRLATGLSTFSEEVASYGHDYMEEILPQIAKERARRAELGVPEPEGMETPQPAEANNSQPNNGAKQGAKENVNGGADKRDWWADTAGRFRAGFRALAR